MIAVSLYMTTVLISINKQNMLNSVILYYDYVGE